MRIAGPVVEGGEETGFPISEARQYAYWGRVRVEGLLVTEDGGDR